MKFTDTQMERIRGSLDMYTANDSDYALVE